MKKKIIIGISLWLCGAFGVYFWNPLGTDRVSYADSFDYQIEQEQANQNELKSQKEEIEKDLKEIKSQKNDLMAYVTSIDSELSKINGQIEANKEKKAELNEDIKKLQDELDTAEQKQAEQQEQMAKRIQYMYENSANTYLDIIFSSESLASLLNNIDYINDITNYDDSLLDTLVQVSGEIKANKSEVSLKLSDLKESDAVLKYQRSSISLLKKQKRDQIKAVGSRIDEKKNEADKYTALIIESENKVEGLLAAQRAAIAAQEQANQVVYVPPVSTEPVSGSSVGSSGFMWPLPYSARITSGFGQRVQPTAGASVYHQGIDIGIPEGTPVLASKAGKVITARYSSSAGNYVCIYHGNGEYTYYMHGSQLNVAEGDQVSQGQQIALSGSTGISTGPHLHFGIFMNGSYVNPLLYVSP
ncbi:MAG: peptidoglycan DD-metalloendopeptidase family protein [Lachnospiraceae bacterium]|jgi:murein DD-endopeptidase MepM/ murein hydrolase activator NlpD|nr:peptidoglycan DD-metalloendopeptidase family protein [Lachnospiraceae bacterium]MEE3460311.1 peptidoglycan DD-metalloendopeptidase family protein [Lachnospiraceae bacterium]